MVVVPKPRDELFHSALFWGFHSGAACPRVHECIIVCGSLWLSNPPRLVLSAASLTVHPAQHLAVSTWGYYEAAASDISVLTVKISLQSLKSCPRVHSLGPLAVD